MNKKQLVKKWNRESEEAIAKSKDEFELRTKDNNLTKKIGNFIHSQSNIQDEIEKEFENTIILTLPSDNREIVKIWAEFDKDTETSTNLAWTTYDKESTLKSFIKKAVNDAIIKEREEIVEEIKTKSRLFKEGGSCWEATDFEGICEDIIKIIKNRNE